MGVFYEIVCNKDVVPREGHVWVKVFFQPEKELFDYHYVPYYWDSGNELSMMMLDYYHHTQDAEFVKTADKWKGPYGKLG